MKKIILTSLFATIAVFFYFGILHALTIAFEENFDAYNTGDLNGQGSWTASTDIDVTTSQAQSGTKSITDTTAGDDSWAKSFTAITQDFNDNYIFTFYSRMDTTGGEVLITVRDGATEVMRLRHNGGNSLIEIFDGFGGTGTNSFQDVATGLSTDTWYKTTVEWDFTNDKYRAKVDEGSFTTWYFMRTAADESSIDNFANNLSNGNLGQMWVDTIQITDTTETGTESGIILMIGDFAFKFENIFTV